MTDAFEIKKDNKLIAVIDQTDFGQEHYKNQGIIIPEAENYAKLIVDALNEKEKEKISTQQIGY